MQTTQMNDCPDDLLEVVDESNENTGGEHENVSADCGFCSYDVLEKVEEQRNEEFYIPDPLFEKSKKYALEKKRYGFEEIGKDADGNYICPAGKVMKYVGLAKNSQRDEMEKYIGRGCGECPLKKKCTNGKYRSLYVDLQEGYRERMRE